MLRSANAPGNLHLKDSLEAVWKLPVNVSGWIITQGGKISECASVGSVCVCPMSVRNVKSSLVQSTHMSAAILQIEQPQPARPPIPPTHHEPVHRPHHHAPVAPKLHQAALHHVPPPKPPCCPQPQHQCLPSPGLQHPLTHAFQRAATHPRARNHGQRLR